MLKLEDKAPLFDGVDQDGKMHTLESLLSDCERLILYFYPRDNTPGCTAEACSLRDGYTDLIERGFKVVGVSPDTEQKHQKFIEKHSLPFVLLADTEHRVAESYGCWGLKKFMGRESMGLIRKTFVINQEGLIERIFEKVVTKDHYNQILKTY